MKKFANKNNETPKRKVISREVITFPVLPNEDNWVTISYNGHGIIEDGDVFYCNKCGTYYKTNNSFDSLPWDDCETERKRIVNYYYRAFFPHKAIISKREDGSVCYNMVIKEVKPVVMKNKNGEPFIKINYRYACTAIVTSANGNTYVIQPRWANKTHRRVLMARSMSTNIFNITKYTINSISVGNDIFDTLLIKMFYYLEKQGYVQNVENLPYNNRFRNLKSEELRAEIKHYFTAHFSRFTQKYIDKIFRSIKPDNDDMTVMFNLKTRYRLPKSKAFNRFFFKAPIKTTLCYLLFKRFGFKDINNFYTLLTHFNADDSLLVNLLCFGKENRKFEPLIRQLIRENEVSLVRASANNSRFCSAQYIPDIYRYCSTLSSYGVTIDELKGFFYGSLDHIHDSLGDKTHEMEEIRRTLLNARNYEDSLRIALARSHSLPAEQKQKILTQIALQNDRPIPYKKNEGFMETTHNGIDFVLPRQLKELKQAGKALHNCVGDHYLETTYFRKSTIVFMKEDTKFVGCIEVIAKNGTYITRQAFGNCNKILKGKYKDAFDEWLKKHYIKEGDNFPRYAETFFADVSNFEEEVLAELKNIEGKSLTLSMAS